MAKKLSNKRLVGTVLSAAGILAVIAGAIIGNTIAYSFNTTLIAALGTYGKNQTKSNVEGVDLEYYKSDYNSKAELEKHEKDIAKQICEEGMVLLEKGNIPYAKSNKISFFSESSVNFIFGGTGSGAADSELSLKSVFEDAGYDVNESLWKFYQKGKGKSYHRGSGSINYGDSDDYSINECPLSVIKSEKGLESSFSTYDTAVFVLSRTGGEGNDLARGMDDYVDTSLDLSKGKHPDAEGDKKKSYLEPDSIELEIIDYLNKNFKDVILLVNCNNTIELGWTKNYEKISTILQVPGAGSYGIQAIPSILKGEVTPSGKLTDTYAYDVFSSPAMMNMGDFQYLVDGKQVPNLMNQSWANGCYYVTYNEGIYVGYRYYETRYEDSIINQGNAKELASWEVGASKTSGSENWDYAKEVQYPFGYGASTTDFSWTNFNVTRQGDDFIATIDVQNIGEKAGKDVVQLYSQTPYGEYEKANGIEKSAVELIGYTKTKELAPQEKETVTINFDLEALKSYDQNNAKTYILSQGQYYFTAAYDAHAAINNILKDKGYSSLVASPSEDVAGNTSLVNKSLYVDTLDTTTFANDTTTNTPITNQFSFADITTYDPSVKYLSRNAWSTTYPKTYGEVSTSPSIHSERYNGDNNGQPEGYQYYTSITKDSEIYKLLTSNESLNPTKDEEVTTEVKWNQSSELELIDLRGASFNDPRWDELISKMSLEEAAALIQNGGYKIESVPSINKPETADKDGPAGLNSIAGHFALGLTYPCGLLIAQTWNKELAKEKGICIGEDGLRNEVSGWYGPGNNIHRTPFAGRNFEYYSEDPVLSASVAKEEIYGAATKGVFAYLKHFALNNQEVHREKESGIATYSNEQAIREIYLKAFESAIKDGEVTERYYEIQTDSNGNLLKDEKGNYQFTEKTTSIKATTAIMSSFNRIGPVWAGGCYPLLTSVLKNEWGYEGMILTDYYHYWFMNSEQAIRAGGCVSLDPEEHTLTIDSNNIALQNYAKEAVKRTLYTTVNSNAMNNYIHGVKEIAAYPKYKTYLIIIDAGCGIIALGLGIVLVKCLKPKKNKEQNN